MKSLNQYIKESLLEPEDKIVNNDITVIICYIKKIADKLNSTTVNKIFKSVKNYKELEELDLIKGYFTELLLLTIADNEILEVFDNEIEIKKPSNNEELRQNFIKAYDWMHPYLYTDNNWEYLSENDVQDVLHSLLRYVDKDKKLTDFYEEL